MSSPADALPPFSSGADVARAAILLIGDELLTGKVRDENGHFLAVMLRRRGIRLLEMAVVPDDVAAIGHALQRLRPQVDLLFTTGGVGPTHDDVTLEAIAEATDRPLTRNPRLEDLLRQHYGARLTPDALRMADLPAGTHLRVCDGWPVLRLDLSDPITRIYILPGVPALLRAKIDQLEALDGELPQGGGWHVVRVDTTLEESRLAPLLHDVVARHPEVSVGSYPQWSRGDDGRVSYRVRVTLESPADLAERAESARRHLLERLPESSLLDG